MSRVDRQMLMLLLVGGVVLWSARELMHHATDTGPDARRQSRATTTAPTPATGQLSAQDHAATETMNFARIDQLIEQALNSDGASKDSTEGSTPESRDKSPDESPSATRQAMRRLKALRQCELSMSQSRTALRTGCPRPSRIDDPRADYDALIDATVAALYDLRGEARAAMARGETPEVDPLDVGRAFVHHSNDDVRVAALQILGDLPASEATVEAAQQVVKASNSGEAVLVALDLLKRGHELAPQQTTETLLTALERGGFQVRDTVARELLPFLNSDNLASFQRVLRQAPPRSRVAQYLKQNIEERQRDLAL